MLIAAIFVVAIGVFSFVFYDKKDVTIRTANEKINHFASHKKIMIAEMMAGGHYKCCLKKPCSYCFSNPHEGKIGCDCLEDVMNGKHPCGECTGEILEGGGNPFLAEYFAVALADEIGVSHLKTLKQIVFEKYGMPVEKQL